MRFDETCVQYANTFDITVISHCEELSLADGGSANEGAMATSLGLRGITPAAEEVMVARDVLLAENEGVPAYRPYQYEAQRGNHPGCKGARRKGDV